MKNNDELARDFNRIANEFDFENWRKFEYGIEGVSYFCVYANDKKLLVEDWYCAEFFYEEDEFEKLKEENAIKDLSISYTDEFYSINQWFFDFRAREISIKAEKLSKQDIANFSLKQNHKKTLNLIMDTYCKGTIVLYDIPKSWVLPFYIPMPKDKDYRVRVHPFLTFLFLSKSKLKRILNRYDNYEKIERQYIQEICNKIDDKIENLQLNQKYGLKNNKIEFDKIISSYKVTDLGKEFDYIKKQSWDMIALKINFSLCHKYSIYVSGFVMVLALIIEHVINSNYLGFWSWLGLTWFVGLLSGVRIFEILEKHRLNKISIRIFPFLHNGSFDLLYWKSLLDWQQKTALAILCFGSVYLIFGYFM